MFNMSHNVDIARIMVNIHVAELSAETNNLNKEQTMSEPRYDLVSFKGFLFLYRTLDGKCETLKWAAYNADSRKLEIKADYNELVSLQNALISGSDDIQSDTDIQAIRTRIFQIENSD